MARSHTLLVALALIATGCDESKPGIIDSKIVADSKAAADSKLVADGKAAADGKTGESKPTSDLKLAVEVARDQGKVDASASFPCGALLACTTATQYCEKFSGGPCGGPAPSDAGVCPPNCTLTTCGSGGQQVCLCQTFTCKALPSGCKSCACVGASAACSCSQFATGAINVSCAAP